MGLSAAAHAVPAGPDHAAGRVLAAQGAGAQPPPRGGLHPRRHLPPGQAGPRHLTPQDIQVINFLLLLLR